MQSDDPTDVRVLVVSADDVVTALEANRRSDADAVLRVTPPFSGRMRARIHREDRVVDYDDPAPVHVPPAALVADVPPYPTPDDTEDELRAAGDYSPDRHREAHVEAVREWRTAVRDRIRDRVTLVDGHEVEVATLA